MRQFAHLHAFPVILHTDDNVLSRFPCGDSYKSIFLQGFNGVFDQIDKSLFELGGAAEHLKSALQLKLNGSPLQIGQRHQNAGDMPKLLRHLKAVECIHSRLGKGQKVRDDKRSSVELLHSHLQVFLLLLVRAFPQNLQKTAGHLQGIAHLMGDRSSELADNLHFLRPLQIIIEFLQVTGIFEHLLMIARESPAQNENKRNHKCNNPPLPPLQLVAVIDVVQNQLS
ncbi:hypothetical protein D3C75_724850 [compost metagenome]